MAEPKRPMEGPLERVLKRVVLGAGLHKLVTEEVKTCQAKP